MKRRTTLPTDSKILSRPQAAEWIEAHKAAGKTVVFANGCFDVLHVGHIRFLEGAAQEGDFLIVGINSDSSVRGLKGEGRPLLCEADRASLTACISCVDAIVIFDEATADPLLAHLRPNIHAKGTDYTEENVPERATSDSLGIRTAIVGDPKDHSTKEMIRKLRGENESPVNVHRSSQ